MSMRILVIDDEIFMHSVIRRIFSLEPGFEEGGGSVKGVSNELSARECFSPGVFDLIICDTNLVGTAVSGPVICTDFKAMDESLLVVGMSGDAMNERHWVRPDGAFTFIAKPFTMEQLLYAVNEQSMIRACA